jgi:1-acyl-sn-glycerol-3-phosphate acyltransferase
MLRAYLFLLFFIPWTFLCALSAIVFTFIDPGGRAYHRHARLWSRLALLVAGVRVAVEGAELVPRDQPLIFMGNHQGNFDTLALFLAIPRRFSWLAKEELFRVPVFGHSMRRAGYIPLNRGDGREALKSLEAAAAAVRAGASIVIFPEGTRTPDGHLLPFKKGGFLLAAKAGVPIVPFTINGSRSINPRNRLELYPGTITIRFAPPLPVAGREKRREELMEEVRQAITAGLEEQR